MTEMARYLKKQRISLRDIIFKARKPSREEHRESKLPVEEALVSPTQADYPYQFDKDQGNEIPECGGKINGDNEGRDNESCEHSWSTRQEGMVSAQKQIETSCFKSDQRRTDLSEVTKDEQYDCSEAEGNFLISKYLHSLSLADEDDDANPPQLDLPAICTEDGRSLSAIPWSESRPMSSSKSCYEICPNKVPGTTCSSSCSTPITRRKKQQSYVGDFSGSSNEDSEAEIIEFMPVSVSRHADKLSNLQQSLALLKLSDNLSSSSFHEKRGPSLRLSSPKNQASSLHVSPNLSPNVSSGTTPCLSPCASPTIPSDFSPFRLKHCHSPSRSRSAHLFPMTSSSSIPNLNHSELTPYKKLPRLDAKSTNALTRSHPNLNTISHQYTPSESSSSCSIGSTSPRLLLSPTHMPTPPASPRTSTRSSARLRRVGKIRVRGVPSVSDRYDCVHVEKELAITT